MSDAPRDEGAAHRRWQSYFLRAAFETSLRDFTDTENHQGSARTYRAIPILGFFVGAQAYPLLGGLLGLDAGFARSLGLHSTTSERADVDTEWTRVEASLRGRIPIGKGERISFVTPFAGYGYSAFVFDSAPAHLEIPTAKYHALRFGADGRVVLGRLFFEGGAEYDHVVSIAGLGTLAARTPGNGVTARLGAGFRLLPWLVARVDGRFSWLRYDLDRTIASHAVDMYGGLQAGFGAEF